MRRLKTSVAILLLLVMSAAVGFAADPAPDKSSATPTQEMAIYSVPKLMEGTMLKDLAKALSAQTGIVSAQVDSGKSTFNVTFEPKKTDPDQILKVITNIARDAKLVSVGPADPKAAAHDCGKCPKAKSCSGAQKK